jgi:hypothetical protein
MRGFLLGALGLTMLQAVLSGVGGKRSGNVLSLIKFPATVVNKILDPNTPFFTAPAKGSSSSSSSSSSGSAVAPGTTIGGLPLSQAINGQSSIVS